MFLAFKTDKVLLAQLKKAAKQKMTPEQVREQRISFVYGNMPANSTITRGQVEKALEKLEGTAG